MALRLVVVEDEPLIALDLIMMLEDLGHEVVAQAADTPGAIAAADVQRPDMMLMDVRLAKGSDGVEAATAVMERFGIRSLFVSGNIDGGLRERAAPIAPLGFASKPLDMDRLEAMLREAQAQLAAL